MSSNLTFSLFFVSLFANAYNIKNESDESYQMALSQYPQEVITIKHGEKVEIDNEIDGLFIARGAAHDAVSANNANYIVGPSIEIDSLPGVKYVQGEFEVLIGPDIVMDNEKTSLKIKKNGYLFYQFYNASGEVIVTGQVPPYVRPF